MIEFPISPWALVSAYLMLIFPIGLILWWKLPLLGQMIIAVLRMTVQLLFVGLYLQFVFALNHPLLNVAWLIVMIGVADVSIIRGSRLRLRRFLTPMFLGLVAGTVVPLMVFIGLVIDAANWFDAPYFIPIGGMILGNCMRANIIGVRTFYESIRERYSLYLQTLGHGATLYEATRPFMRQAGESALAPTIATVATMGLVSLPGMMTGVILGGADPIVAVKYQIAIMLAIFAGTAITVGLVILMTFRRCFDEAGMLDPTIYR
jgi:putative ABC transport system permease protein